MAPNFDRIAQPYRWLEWLSFGPLLQRCRLYRLPQLAACRRALVLGDGDGRFLAALLLAQPALQAEAVDGSQVMLRLLNQRATAVGAGARLTVRCEDIRTFAPLGEYDLVVSHFFLDCLTTDEVEALAARILPRLHPGTVWIVSDFAIPKGPLRPLGRILLASLYAAFGILTGLKVRQLPRHGEAFRGIGFQLKDRKEWLGGILVSELWRAEATAAPSPVSHGSCS